MKNNNQSILESLKEYFNNTDPEQIEKDWKSTEKYDQIGPTVEALFTKINEAQEEKITKYVVMEQIGEDHSVLSVTPLYVYNTRAEADNVLLEIESAREDFLKRYSHYPQLYQEWLSHRNKTMSNSKLVGEERIELSNKLDNELKTKIDMHKWKQFEEFGITSNYIEEASSSKLYWKYHA